MNEKYILGELSPQEIDDLWIGFLQYPELFDYFMTELHLRNLNTYIHTGTLSSTSRQVKVCVSNNNRQ